MGRQAKFLDESGNDVGILSTIKCSPEMHALWSMTSTQLGLSKAELMKRMLYEYGIDVGLVNPNYLPADVPDVPPLRELQKEFGPEPQRMAGRRFMKSPLLRRLKRLIGSAMDGVPEGFFTQGDSPGMRERNRLPSREPQNKYVPLDRLSLSIAEEELEEEE